jgi:hypothetical protein
MICLRAGLVVRIQAIGLTKGLGGSRLKYVWVVYARIALTMGWYGHWGRAAILA